jgi:hypothetical protein
MACKLTISTIGTVFLKKRIDVHRQNGNGCGAPGARRFPNVPGAGQSCLIVALPSRPVRAKAF